ncbi:MAG: pyridoxamine 5'-phosphate oxidase family protein [Methylococcales bacterium]
MDHLSQNESYRKLVQSQQTLILSTVTTEGKPESSYAPYVRDEQGVFYIYVSELATHTQNMLKTAFASILFIQAEKECKNLFARKRVVFDCSIKEVKSQDECYYKQMLIMKETFGETIELLQSLSDFHLLALTPVNGKYIAGFGKVFSINLESNSLQFEN